jgi:hypothetical protein
MKMKFANLLGGLFLLGVSLVGCVSVDEPKGIQDLRSAKAEFLKADAAVRLADAKYREAQTAQETAKAKGIEIDNQMKSLAYERQKTLDDLTKAQIDAQIKVLEITLQSQILNAKQALANAQQSYDVALARLDVAKKLDIPQEYKDGLTRVVNSLGVLLAQMSSCENQISNLTADIRDYTLDSAKDSARVSNGFRNDIQDAEQNLTISQKMLADAKLASTSDNADLKKQLEGINAKIATLKGDVNAYNSKVSTCDNEYHELLEKEANYCFLLGITNPSSPISAFKTDYTTKISVPVVAEIVTAIKSSPVFYKFLSADNLSLTFSGSLNNVIDLLNNPVNGFGKFIADNKTATEGWNALETARAASLKSFADTKAELTSEFNELENSKTIKSNERSTLYDQVNTANFNLSYYNGLAFTIQNRISNIDNSNTNIGQMITNAENAVRDAQAKLDFAKLELANYLKKDYVTLRNQIENQIKLEQAKLAGYKTLFDQATKDKDALIVIINGLNK